MLPPISLKPENITEKELGFSWVSQSVDASKIIVERLTSDNEEWDEIEELSGAENHFLDANLECNKKYAYRLKVFRESDNQFSDYSDVIQITTSECSLLFFDDFSNDKQWINLSDNNIYRDIKNNYIAWDVTNETSRRFYHSIDTQVDRIKISFDFKITNNNNGSLAIGLVENLDAPTQIEEIDATGIFVRLFHADDADWIGVLANYLDSSYYDTESFIRQPEINHIGKAVLIINKGNWNLTISDDEANITEQQSGLLPSQHLAYQYVMLVSDKTGGHGSQSGIIDNLTIEKYNP